jgi:hypothetical protein
MAEYAPKSFKALYEEPMGQDLWKLLTDRETIIRMETATYLGKPAVEPLGTILWEEFGDEVRKDRTKQMIGHMARQIMEGQGYNVDRSGVRIAGYQNNIFSSATRYKK